MSRCKAAMIYTGRGGFVSLEESYHGNSLGGLSVGDSENREHFRNLLPHCSKIEPPLNEQALDKVETRLKGRNVAAFIMEPIIINLGVLVPEQRFMQGLQASAGSMAPSSSPTKSPPVLAAPESFSRASISIFGPTSCAWRKPSPAATAAWERLDHRAQ